jgi:hypothetical protein
MTPGREVMGTLQLILFCDFEIFVFLVSVYLHMISCVFAHSLELGKENINGGAILFKGINNKRIAPSFRAVK